MQWGGMDPLFSHYEVGRLTRLTTSSRQQEVQGRATEHRACKRPCVVG